MNNIVTHILIISGLDPSGYAGFIADIRTVTALKAVCSGVVTALTNQTKNAFFGVSHVPPESLKNQLYGLFRNNTFDAVKIGMVYSRKNIEIIAEIIQTYQPPNVVLDPIITSTSGGALLEPDAVQLLKTALIPLASIVTPNIPEAEQLSGITINSPNDAKKAGKRILDLGCSSVFVKGGHLTGNAADILIDSSGIYEIPGTYIDTPDFRGTGCVISSAAAVFLSYGQTIFDSVTNAKRFLEKARKTFVQTKNGFNILNVFDYGGTPHEKCG